MDAATAGEVVSKGRFAELRNVSPGRVSQWISEGKLKPSALVGEGRNAKINVAVATSQLRETLDIGQRTGNGINTSLDLQPPPAAPASDVANETRNPPPSSPPPSDAIADQIKQEKLAGLQRENRRRAEEEAARSGKYIEAAEAVRQMGAIAAQMMSMVEGSLTELATAISAKFEIPQRDVLHLMRGEFRKVRSSGAKVFRDKAMEMPAIIEAELADVDGVV